jgi:hypothetical protein
MDPAMSDVLIKLTGLWERTRRGNTEGQFYLVGRLGAAKILAFKNHRKESDADPDWNLFLTESTLPKRLSADPAPDKALALAHGLPAGDRIATTPIPDGGDEIPF